MTWTVAHSVPGRLRLRSTERPSPERRGSVEAALRDVPGIIAVDARPATRSVCISYDRRVASETIVIDALGATVAPELHPTRAHRDAPPETRRPAAIESPWHLVAATAALATPWLPLAGSLKTAIVLGAGSPVLLNALRSGRRRGDVVEAVTLAMLGLRGQHAAAAALAWFRAAGDFAVQRIERGARRSLRQAVAPVTRTAVRLDDGRPRTVPVAALRPADLVAVRSGADVPVDGQIVDGEALVSEQTITGEPLPVERRAGERVFAATRIEVGEIVVRADRVGAETVVGRMARAIEEAAAAPSEVEHVAADLADRQAPRTLALSAVGATFARSVDAGVAIAVADHGMAARVGVPVALLTPLARAARAGIVVKGARPIEELARVDTFVVDKTGTLTVATPRIGRVTLVDGATDEATLLRLIVAAERSVDHPVARAVAQLARERGLAIPAQAVEVTTAGVGIEARVDGRPVLVGSRRFMETRTIDLAGGRAEETRAHAAGASPAFVAVDGRLAGVLVLEDAVRREASPFLAALGDRGIRDVVMVTGDHRRSAQAVAATLGLPTFHSDLLPEDKAEIVRGLRRRGRVVAMVGDGVNDALALHEADVGIAVGGGPQLVAEAADVVVVSGDLRAVVRALDLARDALQRVESAVRTASSINLAVLALASFGVAPPLASILISRGGTLVAALSGFELPAR